MFQAKAKSLKTLLNSSEGIHLSLYLRNDGTIIDLQRQLKSAINDVRENLEGVMSLEDQVQLIQPLKNLLTETSLLKGMKGNIGMFRTDNSFRILSLPTHVEPLTVVASSFHVKPLLRWLQTDREFLLLGIEEYSASLYWGSSSQFKLVDTIIFPEIIRKHFVGYTYDDLKNKRDQRLKQDETIEWLNEWLYETTKEFSLPLFLAGKENYVKPLTEKVRYPRLQREPITSGFSKNSPFGAVAAARQTLLANIKKELDSALREFQWAEDSNMVEKSIFEISKAAVQGKVKKMLISDSIQIFGRLDKETGAVTIHPFHLNHEDDDLLDDLAQLVIQKGGQVVIASQAEIPKRRPIMAILKRPTTKLRHQAPEVFQSENQACG